MMMPRYIAAAFAFAFGACMGSFVALVAFRLPRNISIVRPRSYCPKCKQPIPVWTNIPLAGFLVLRSRCYWCRAPIAPRYFLVELALATTALYLFLNFTLPDAMARFVFCAALFAVALIDLEWRVIPIVITIPGAAVGFAGASLLIPEVGWQGSLLGMALGAGFLFVVGEIYRLARRREGLGLGDVWLMAMVGAFTGWTGVFFTLFAGSLMGSICGLIYAWWLRRVIQEEESDSIKKRPPVLQTALPFGPFLALAALVFTLFQPRLIDWYLFG